MGTVATKGLRRWQRQEYLRAYAENRRASHKADGARRIDVTLTGDMLDDYAFVRQWIKRLNQLGIERGFYNTPLTGNDGVTFVVRPKRLSATEVIRAALSLAAAHIEDET